METSKTWRIYLVRYNDSEMKTLACVVLGLNHQQIADCLCRSKSCIKNNLTLVYGKLEVNTIHRLALVALRIGFDFRGYYKGEQVLSVAEQTAAEKHKIPHL